jgi:hypothetical protein
VLIGRPSNFSFGVLPLCACEQAAEAAEAQEWVDSAHATPVGEKKKIPAEMPKGYVPKAVEAAW